MRKFRCPCDPYVGPRLCDLDDERGIIVVKERLVRVNLLEREAFILCPRCAAMRGFRYDSKTKKIYSISVRA